MSAQVTLTWHTPQSHLPIGEPIALEDAIAEVRKRLTAIGKSDLLLPWGPTTKRANQQEIAASLATLADVTAEELGALPYYFPALRGRMLILALAETAVAR